MLPIPYLVILLLFWVGLFYMAFQLTPSGEKQEMEARLGVGGVANAVSPLISALRPLFALTRTARQLSAQMQRAWIAFARTGDPSHEELPDWPAYDGDGAATLELSSDPRLLHAPFAPALRFWSELAEAPTSGAGVAASARTRPHG